MTRNKHDFIFVALGDGLAAGMADFSLRDDSQMMSFPAQLARQMGVSFPQALVRGPGIGHAPGFARLPVLVPANMQTRVLEKMPPPVYRDLCVPGLTIPDCLHLRATQPLVHRNDPRQTACNLILGLDAMAYREAGKSQLEHAVTQRPGLALVSFGYSEALEAAVAADPSLLPEPGACRGWYSEIFSALRETGADLLVTTIPDPLDTAYFSSLEQASRILKIERELLVDIYGITAGELLTLNGLMEIGFQFFGRAVAPLPETATLKASVADMLRSKIGQLNRAIADAANEHGALLYDMHELFGRIHRAGGQAGARPLTADFLGGFYRLNGYYPGHTGHALIANGLIALLNESMGMGLSQIDVSNVAKSDPAAAYRPADGRAWKREDLPQPVPEREETQEEIREASSAGGPAVQGPLTLPEGLEQVLPLSEAASYFGDGIGAMNCHNARDIQWGNSADLIFGGLAMVDSHLKGKLKIVFSPPAAGKTRFQISFMGGFAGRDAELVTPQLFRMPFQRNRVDEVPGTVSSGVLDLATGEVSDLKVFAQYSSTALLALVSVNPNFPKQPLSFPGPYGSAWARFEQRADGKLDFTFYGSAYVPLGKDTRWPLPFAGPSGQFATIPANGTVMHPHLQLSTKPPQSGPHQCPEIPFNSVQEYTIHTHNSAFGDKFTLNVPQLGGPAKGRSHVMGRLLIQFGARSANSVPVAITGLNPGGLLMDLPGSPITAVFPGQLAPGPQGFSEELRFPLRTYSLNDLAILDDPFDISVGLADLNSGLFINQLLHRGFIHQDLIFALLRVEPRTPKDSFYFRGPARLEKGPDGRAVFRFEGVVRVPYPADFFFPEPNMATAFVVGPNSVLDPFLWNQAMEGGGDRDTVAHGEAANVVSSTGERFSYRYVIAADPSSTLPVFEYENHTQKGSFTMHSLAWVSFSNSLLASPGTESFDTVTFSGFGVWSKDGIQTIQQVAAQFCVAPEAPYIGIQVAGADVSNVNTKPENETAALP